MPPPTCFLSFLLQSCHRQNIALRLKVPNFAGQLSRNMTYHMLSLSAYSKKMHGIALVLVYYTFEHYMELWQLLEDNVYFAQHFWRHGYNIHEVSD